MATQHSRSAARVMMAPAVILLLGWMLVPLTMTLYFSFKKYLPLRGDSIANGLDWVGFANYTRFVGSSSFWPSVQTTLIIVGGVLVVTVILGIALALLLVRRPWARSLAIVVGMPSMWLGTLVILSAPVRLWIDGRRGRIANA